MWLSSIGVEAQVNVGGLMHCDRQGWRDPSTLPVLDEVCG